MKKNNLILLIILIQIISLSYVFSQKTGVYRINNKTSEKLNQKLAYLIVLYPANEYEILISDNYHDIFFCRYISFGKYYLKDDTIYLKDHINGYFIKMMTKGNSIYAVQSFNWMLNLTFEYFEGFQDLDSIPFFQNKGYHQQFLKELGNYNVENKIKYNFNIGKYKSTTVSWPEEFNFSPDSTYKIIFKNTIISEGTWRRDENLIILKDITLNFEFYVFIKSDSTLDGKYLPSYSSREIFIYSN